MERLVRGDAVFIAGAVRDHRPCADRDQYLARRHRSSADQQGVWAGHYSTVEHDLDAVVLTRLGVESSEERCVGKECVCKFRSRWWPYHSKHKLRHLHYTHTF